MTFCWRLLLALITLVALTGCKREAPPAPAKTSSAAAAKKSPIARVVFVGKEKACPCTRDRIDKSWKALTGVVGFPPESLDLERVHVDSQADKAAKYKKQRPIVVLPAIYFFDKQGKLVEVLQGEVKSAQIKKLLGAG